MADGKTGGEICLALEEAFSPSKLLVRDQSHMHRGHAGWREGGETHFRIEMSGEALEGMGRVERHRAIHRAIGPEIMERIHALEIVIRDS